MKKVILQSIGAILLAAIAGWFNIVGLALAFGLIKAIEIMIRWVRAGENVFLRLGDVLYFLWDFFFDLTKSNLLLAWDVITPEDKHTVRLVEVPIGDLTDGEAALLMHRITLTPGTLSAAVIHDHSTLVVHAMYGETKSLSVDLRRPLDILKAHAREERRPDFEKASRLSGRAIDGGSEEEDR